MGCDIHAHVEIKVRGEWLHWEARRPLRDYGAFEKMAGVRGEVGNAIVAPRGLPDDVSATTRFDCEWWDGDGHSHSWLSAKEMSELRDWWKRRRGQFDSFEQQFGFVLGSGWPTPFLWQDSWEREQAAGVEDYRLVFWFDN